MSIFDLTTSPDGWTTRQIGLVNGSTVHARLMVDTQAEFHVHAFDEMFIVLSGRLCVDLEMESIELSSGQSFTVRQGLRHRARAIGRVELLTIIGEPD